MALLHEVSPKLTAASFVRHGTPPLTFGVVSVALALIDPACIVMLSIVCGVVDEVAKYGQVLDLRHHFGFGVAVAALFSIAAHAHGLYIKSKMQRLGHQIKSAILIWMMVFLCLGVVTILLQVSNAPSWSTLVLFFVSGLSVVALLRCGTQRVLAQVSRSVKRPKYQVVVVSQMGRPLSASVGRAVAAPGRNVCRTILLPEMSDENRFSESMREVVDFVRRQSVDEILLAINWSNQSLIEEISEHLRGVPLAVRLIPDPDVNALLERPLLELGDTRAVELQRAPLTQSQAAAKQLLDVALSIPALILLLPTLVSVAALIRLESPGRVLFRQRRIGFNGRPFYIYKFRTMRTLEDGSIIRQACRGDARITRVGQVLRKYSIDELPQLLNVLKGEMSLVGPRPHALAHDIEYGQAIALYAVRHNVKPGITGWAQVNGWRGATPQIEMMMRRVEHDLWYIQHWSHWLDIKILLLTVFSPRTGRNAF